MPISCALSTRTPGGNALFVSEVVKLLAAERATRGRDGGWLPFPEGVREAISRRIERLSPSCAHVLVLASVFGRSFRIDALARVVGGPRPDLLRALDEAEREGLIGGTPALGEMRFSHALVRDAVYEGLPATRRMELHLEAGLALERTYGADRGPHLAEIAHHLLLAAPLGEGERAVSYARRAADRAVAVLAYEEGARLYEAALGALDFAEDPAPRSRCELLVELGDARLRAGDESGAKAASREAAELARPIGAADLLARAALGYGGRFVWTRPGTDIHVVPLLEEALTALGGGDDVLRARVLARLAGALRDQPDRAYRASLSAEAVAVAERTGDRPTLAYALTAHFTANWGPENADEQLTIATRLVELSEAIGDRDRAVEARLIRHKVLTYLGDINSARADLRIASRLAEESRQPSHRWFIAVDGVTSALFEGRFDEAEERAPEVLGLGRDAMAGDADVAFRLHMFALRREQGRAGEIEELIRSAVADHPGYPMFRCVLANLYACMGETARARTGLDALAEDDFGALPRDNEWLFAMCLLPEVAEAVGDAEVAARLFDHLRPFAPFHAYSAPELGLGAAARYVGIAAASAGRIDDAIGYLEQGLARNEAMGARPWVAHSQHDLAKALRARGRPRDERRAEDLLQRCLELSAELGMLMLELKVVSLQQGVGRLGHENAFARAGEYWDISYEGRTFWLKDSKGLGYLSTLLAEPGREFHALQLAAGPGARPEGKPAEVAARAEGDLGVVLDARAIEDFRRRIAELESDAAEARSFGDAERASRAETERDVIVETLAGAVGLGGRARRSGGPGERARVSVTKAIRSALDRIATHDPDLGRHLRTTVRTGAFCSYSPDPRAPASWSVSRS